MKGEFMEEKGFWIEEFPAAITVTDAEGTILAMNRRSCETFAAEGGAALMGSSILACHPEPARSKLTALFKRRSPNSYTIRKGGRKKVIHQIPWYRDGAFAGFVEVTIPIPDELPHFDRE